jgi:hypothetical protein
MIFSYRLKQAYDTLLGRVSTSSTAWHATHKHRKGGLYRVICHGQLEADHTPVVIYDDQNGTTWVRPLAEFIDGRFTPI